MQVASIKDVSARDIDVIYAWLVEQRGSSDGLDRASFVESLLQLEAVGLVRLEVRQHSLVFSLPKSANPAELHLPR